jgi:hypothetical protein
MSLGVTLLDMSAFDYGSRWAGKFALVGVMLGVCAVFILNIMDEGIGFVFSLEGLGEFLVSVPLLFVFFGFPIVAGAAAVGFVLGLLYGWLFVKRV